MDLDMDKARLTFLWTRYIGDSLTVEESMEFKRIVNDPQNQITLEELLTEYYYGISHEVDLYGVRDKKQERIYQYIVSQPQNRYKKTYSFWMKYVAAALLLCVLGLGYYMYRQGAAEQYLQLTNQSDVEPGKMGATLTLADGRKISLADLAKGELITESGGHLSKNADGALSYTTEQMNANGEEGWNTLSTTSGEMIMMVMPDKSKVWLNAESSLEFLPTLNRQHIREVKLKGEAYFEVAKDKQRPFVVVTDRQKITVLGTHFNVSSYGEDNKSRTTLLEGSVQVESPRSSKSAILKPLQQAIVVDNAIQVRQADAEEAVAWKNGDFVFGIESFEESLRKIERWYNIEFEYNEKEIKDVVLDGWISRNSKLSEVLRRIEQAGSLQFKIKERRVMVRKK